LIGAASSPLPPRLRADAKTVDITYHYQIAKVATWVNSQEMKTAYPSIAAALSTNPSDRATLVMTGDHWEFVR
jgi:hypothetical protein